MKVIDVKKSSGISESQSYALRLFVNQTAPELSAVQLCEVSDMLEAWAPNTPYAVNDVRTYGGDVYRCIQAHASQTGWEPSATPALWEKQAGANADGIPVWIQKYDGVGYMTGDKVCYPDSSGDVYESTVDYNVWAPDVYGWQKATDASETGESGGDVGGGEYPGWVQPTGAHDAYNIGDKVSYGGKKWVCTINGNVWAPDVTGWNEEME